MLALSVPRMPDRGMPTLFDIESFELLADPWEPGERKAREDEDGRERAEGASRRVLVVEDNADSAETLGLILELWGHVVCTALDGPSALEKAEEFKPDLVLLDIGLPGMDGYEVARRLRRQGSLDRAVLVAMTGYGLDEDRRRSAEAGFDHHLVKPVEPETLAALVNGVS